MANRALRSSTARATIPPDLHTSIDRLHAAYDYGFHADTARPHNLEALSEPLWRRLLDELAIFGGPPVWAERVGRLSRAFDGIVLVLPPGTTAERIALLGEKLQQAARDMA
jgi:hypothetical protein